MKNPHFEHLLSRVYDGALAPEHLDDLRKSALTDDTIGSHYIRSVPPVMIPKLLGFDIPAIQSALLFPFRAPDGGFMDHVRMKVFPTLVKVRRAGNVHYLRQGDEGPDDRHLETIKYLQPKRSGVRIYFPLTTLGAVLHSDATLYIIEGEKKALSVAQHGHATIGLCGIEGWHLAGRQDLHPDLDDVGLRGRRVKVIPDADARTNPVVADAVRALGQALAARGARADLVHVPDGFKGIDDWLAATS